MLTQEDIRKYQTNGYLVLEELIRCERLAHYKSVFDEFVVEGSKLTHQKPHWSLELDTEGRPQEGLLHKIQGICMVDSRALTLARERPILDAVETLLKTHDSYAHGQIDIDVFGTKFFPKLPSGGTSTRWHQDNYYFGTQTDYIISCAIYLEDSDPDNGCLKVVPGSHRTRKILEHHRDSTTHGIWTQVDASRAVDVSVPAGTVVLFSANLLHGAHDNSSSRTRYSTAWHYLPADINPPNIAHGEYEDRHSARKAGRRVVESPAVLFERQMSETERPVIQDVKNQDQRR